VVSYFLRYFSSTSTEQISSDSTGPFTSFDPVGFAIFGYGRSETHGDPDAGAAAAHENGGMSGFASCGHWAARALYTGNTFGKRS
jgi:hypothetical protein